MIALNQVLSGKYRITGRLAGGGMSAVYTAEDVQLGKTWAVKVLDTKKPEYERLLKKDGTLDEIEILKALDHPLAPRMVDMFTEDGDICIVMDLIKGESLQAVLDREGAQSSERTVRWMRDICGLLSYLHQNGIIYRDLKPANVILCEDGSVRLVDFGYPTKIVKDGVFSDSEAFGTPGYAAPEQIKRYSDARSDVYAAGVTMRQLLTGEAPPAKGRPRHKAKELAVSPGLRAVIEKAAAPSPKDRFQSMDELCDALLNYKKAEKPYLEKLRKKLAFSSFLLYLGLSLALCGVLVFEGFYLRDLHEYKSIIGTPDAKEEELKTAASLLPARPESYEKLALLYSKDGLSEDELAELSELYDSYESSVFIKNDAYYGLNYRIACDILCFDGGTSFCDSKIRLEKAAPYLRRASAGGENAAGSAALLNIMAGLSYDEDVSAVSLCSSILSLMKSRSLLIGVNAARFSLFQDAAIANLIEARKNDITEAGSGDFIGTVLQLLEKDVSDLEKEVPYAGEVLALISRVKNETEGE